MNSTLAVGVIAILLMDVCLGQPSPSESAFDRGELAALAKNYFRDTAELPMTVTVSTSVVDLSGRTKKQTQNRAEVVFHGYAPSRGGKVSAKGGITARRQLYDSLSGDLAAIGLASKALGSRGALRVVSNGDGFTAALDDQSCQPFRLVGADVLFPTRDTFCGSTTFHIAREQGAELVFRDAAFESANLPVHSKLPYLGEVEILAFHVDLEFQRAMLPDDAVPFLLPMRAVTKFRTNKGEIVLTNVYEPKAPRKVSK